MSETTRPPLDVDARSVLLVRLRSIGDAVLTLPLAEALRRERPLARIALLLEPPAAELLRGHPAIDEVIEVGRGVGPRLAVLRELRRARFDLALDLHGGPTAALLTALSGARLRVGLASYRHHRAYQVLLRPAGPTPRHTVLANLAIARALGLDPPSSLSPRLAPDDAARSEAREALARAGLVRGEAFVVVHPWAAMRSKTWPLERFLALIERLTQAGHRVVVPGLPGAPSPPSGLPPSAARLDPLSLRALAALLAEARAWVGNDSGPAHIAAAVGTSAVAIFGSQDPQVWRPWPDGVAVWKGLPCSPCAGYGCDNPQPFECLGSISVDEVALALERALASARPRSPVAVEDP